MASSVVMLKQASVAQIRKGEVTRDQGHIAITMCLYPRGLKRELRDEYLSGLAPDRVLFKEWLGYEREFGHDQAFIKSDYENRFELSPQGERDFQRLSDLAVKQDVFLVCQCQIGERCHREMLMLAANKVKNVPIDRVFNEYKNYSQRLAKADRTPGARARSSWGLSAAPRGNPDEL